MGADGWYGYGSPKPQMTTKERKALNEAWPRMLQRIREKLRADDTQENADG